MMAPQQRRPEPFQPFVANTKVDQHNEDWKCQPHPQQQKQQTSLPNTRLSFPQRIYNMLQLCEQNQQEHICSWVNDGSAFKVHDLEAFERELLPRHFTTQKYASFTRALCWHGFHCERTGRQTGIYSHPKFHRNDPAAPALIKRSKAKKPTTQSKPPASDKRGVSNADRQSQMHTTTPTTISVADNHNNNDTAEPIGLLPCQPPTMDRAMEEDMTPLDYDYDAGRQSSSSYENSNNNNDKMMISSSHSHHSHARSSSISSSPHHSHSHSHARSSSFHLVLASISKWMDGFFGGDNVENVDGGCYNAEEEMTQDPDSMIVDHPSGGAPMSFSQDYDENYDLSFP